MHVHIRGDGLAAWCTARLLSRSGFRVTVERPGRRNPRLILVGDPTQALLAELAGDPSPFANAARIRKRLVAWGPNAATQEFEHSAAIVDEQSLLDRLWARTSYEPSDEPAEWTIFGASPAPGEEHRFGSRTANVAEVDLAGRREACWIESFEQGWMFLIAGDSPTGYLISVGARPEIFLTSSRSIAKEVAAVGPAVGPAVRPMEGEVPAYPRLTSPMGGPDWLACGSAAMALDPLCGDGSGHAIREAILAAAVLRAIAKGSSPSDLLHHYESRLGAAFERHLKICEGFYSTGGAGEWWKSELDLLRRGLEFSRERAPQEWHFRLEGFDLLPVR